RQTFARATRFLLVHSQLAPIRSGRNQLSRKSPPSRCVEQTPAHHYSVPPDERAREAAVRRIRIEDREQGCLPPETEHSGARAVMRAGRTVHVPCLWSVPGGSYLALQARTGLSPFLWLPSRRIPENRALPVHAVRKIRAASGTVKKLLRRRL